MCTDMCTKTCSDMCVDTCSTMWTKVPRPDDESAVLLARNAELEAKIARLESGRLQPLPEGEEVHGQQARGRPRGLSLHAIDKEDVEFLKEAPIGEGWL